MQTTRTSHTDDPDDLEVQGHERIAEGHALLAAARRLRASRSPAPSGHVSVAIAAEAIGVKPRVITDAGHRGELTLGRAGRTPTVDRAELARWLTSRSTPPAPSSDVSVVDDAERAVRDAARRMRGGAR
ncbi:MAG: hypothetical protein U0235_28280 [Polyangiaceae bacterium]